MTVPEFAKMIAKEEGKKKQVSIAQILEILKVQRKILAKHRKGFDLYRFLHLTA